MYKSILFSVLVSGVLMLSACGKQGPAEAAGEKVDNAVNQVEGAAKDVAPAQKADDSVSQ